MALEYYVKMDCNCYNVTGVCYVKLVCGYTILKYCLHFGFSLFIEIINHLIMSAMLALCIVYEVSPCSVN